MTENKKTPWFQLISDTRKQHAQVKELKTKMYHARQEISIELDEDDLCCAETNEQSIKKSLAAHEICLVPVFETGVLGPTSFIHKTYKCPCYDKKTGCTEKDQTCENFHANQSYFEIKKKYSQEKANYKNMVRRIFGLKEKQY
ncbi:MAG: hypothetical protein J6W23_02300 [Victivallales bacterium]|nr:hypothetical protein [Victivallales bacterium]